MHRSLYIILTFALFFLSAPLFAEVGDEDAPSEHQQIYHVYDDIDLLPKTNFQYGKSRIVIKIIRPQLVSDSENESVDQFNQLIDDLIQEEVAQFRKDVAGMQSFQESRPKASLKNTLEIDFDASVINVEDHPLISIRFSLVGYMTGMAHPYHRHRVFNYDLTNAELITLESLFKPNTPYLDVIASFSKDVLAKKLPNDFIEAGTTPIPAHYQLWNLKPSGLLITFDEAQVAPYVFGTQTVLIPYSILKEMIAPKAPIAACLTKRKKCLQHHLLTGGFMDEAVNTHHRRLDPILG